MMQARGSNQAGGSAAPKPLPAEDALAILTQGFLKGGSGSGLIKGGTPVSQDVRVGVTHCYVIMVQTLGTKWLEKNLSLILNHILELVNAQIYCPFPFYSLQYLFDFTGLSSQSGHKPR